MDRFLAHGSFSLQVEGRILLLHGEGPGNAELIEQYQLAVQQHRQALAGEPWGNLVVLHGESLLTHDAVQLMNLSIGRSRDSGMVAAAVVLTDTKYPGLGEQLWHQIYVAADMPHAFFADIGSARTWLLEQIEKANS
ncbi:hypothetical protein KJY73_02235 [Bowmanella sp. Y26]|uniref:hypothetical protein n=1 Tax=Bowmanella yangjiangensis TaxID=2811230 RepID=UPI001BDC7C86|nr:hypothetical protein [Bowmanella yangjiangensis]MBT1062369.1 hypothetical protein [Bowmanella yangjiangensis]